MSTRKAIFDAVKGARGGRGFTALEVLKLDVLLDDLGIPRDRLGAKSLTAPDKFFSSIRNSLFEGDLTQLQVDGINAKLAAFGAAAWPIAYAANAFATSYLETAKTMQPIRERGSGDGPDADSWDDYLERYDTGRLAAILGNTPEADGDGVLFAGKGDVQLTGARNYKLADQKLHEKGILKPEESLIRTPILALRPDVSAAVMVFGMEEGWFTGKKLSDYLPNDRPATHAEHKQARRIINGTDRWSDLADYAVRWQAGLQAGGWA